MASATATRYVGYIGAAANWLIPIAGFGNLLNQDAGNINPAMTGTLMCYSAVFWRWSIAISPPNWPLMACHTANASVQALTLSKWAMHTPQSATSSSSTA